MLACSKWWTLLVNDQEISASAETARRQYVAPTQRAVGAVTGANINALSLFFEEHKARYEVPKVEVDRLLTDDLQEDGVL